MDAITHINAFFDSRKKYGIKPGLVRMEMLLQHLEHPEKHLNIIHIAGTNGKGSTATFMKNVLIQSNYRVGFFTSPSFTGLSGHFIINHEEIDFHELYHIFQKVKPIVLQLDSQGYHPTEFEIITAMAFVYFMDRTDLVIVEAGMGGREDTTNVVDPLLSIITSIAMDHIQFLGNTLASIATHKAGIIKQHRPVVLGEISMIPQQIIKDEAKQKDAPLKQYGIDYHVFTEQGVSYFVNNQETIIINTSFVGTYQRQNIATGLQALFVLEQLGFKIQRDKIAYIIETFTVPGRFEKVHDHPLVILDSAHNVAGIKALQNSLRQYYPNDEIQCIFAAFSDKAINDMLEELAGENMEVMVTTFDHERAATFAQIEKINKNYPQVRDWKGYIKKVLQDESCKDIIVITGSMHFTMQVRDFMNKLYR